MSEILSMIDPNNYGLQSMVAGGADLQEKTATPTTSQQVIQADEGYDGLSSVTVNAVTSAIDENIIPTNIRTGKTILGVQGNLEPDKPDQNKTVTPSTVQQVVVADTGYELAQVTVEAVPDETPELNAQDTALSNQETVIGQLSSALDNKIALDLQAATSDATATANDIAKDKTAYVNGVKVTGVAEITDNNALYTTDAIPKNSSGKAYARDGIVELPNITLTAGTTNLSDFLNSWDKLKKVGSIINSGSVTNINSFAISSTRLEEIGSINTENVTSMSSMFSGCYSLKTIPILNTSKVLNMMQMFWRCNSLTNESLNNILYMCANATAYINQGTNMTLAYLGLSQAQATTCQTLSNWDAFVTAGWSTGY